GERPGGRRAGEADRGPYLRQGARDGAAPERRVGAGQVGEPRRHLAAGERLPPPQRRRLRLQVPQDPALEGLLVLGEDEVADAPAHLALHRLELAPDVVHVSAPRAPRWLGPRG